MEEYKVKIYPVAKQDLIQITEYINELSYVAAINQYEKIVKEILSLKNLPMRCPFLKNDNLKRRGYRFLVIDSYLILFVVKEYEVQIRKVVYSKMKYDFLL